MLSQSPSTLPLSHPGRHLGHLNTIKPLTGDRSGQLAFCCHPGVHCASSRAEPATETSGRCLIVLPARSYCLSCLLQPQLIALDTANRPTNHPVPCPVPCWCHRHRLTAQVKPSTVCLSLCLSVAVLDGTNRVNRSDPASATFRRAGPSRPPTVKGLPRDCIHRLHPAYHQSTRSPTSQENRFVQQPYIFATSRRTPIFELFF